MLDEKCMQRLKGGVRVDRELPVSVWPEWKIVEKIGEGSFGKVYKAQRTEKGRSFYSAIKIITIPANKNELNSVRSETADDQSAKEYFENLVEECIQEVSTMEYFRGNSHVVSVEDYKVVEYLDEIGWDIYIRMEYLTSFIEYCAGKNLTEKEVIKLGIDLCKTLEYCSQLNIIHRDIKPENIFVSRFGDFKLGDFGIARELERTMSNLSKKGTYSYMAPEMYRGEQYDSRVDIYSLGLVLYKLMNHNRLPFLNLEKQLITYRDKEAALARRMSGETLPKPVDAGAGFDRIILKACAYRPQDRYQEPEDFRKALEDLRNGRLPREEVHDVKVPSREPGRNSFEEQRTSAPAPRERAATEDKPELSTGKRKRRVTISPWTVVIIIAAIAAAFIGGIYVKVILEDAVRVQTQQMISALEQNNKEISEDTEKSFAEEIETIGQRATTIVNELETYLVEGKEGERLRYYNKDGEIMKVLVYPELSADGVFEEYYYWNGQMFFAYIWVDKKEELYYYMDGQLIRWIDQEGICHDNETEDTEYLEREDKYWKNSVDQLL